MREEKIKAIRQACIKANPEIVELKFGCRYKRVEYKLKISGEPEVLREKEYTIFDTNYTFDGEKFHIDGFVFTEDKGRTYPELGDRMFGATALKDHDNIKFEIIGRPIRLADVLVARGLEHFHNDDKTNELIYGYRHSWNLLRDSLDEQSDECIEFIHGLLTN